MPLFFPQVVAVMTALMTLDLVGIYGPRFLLDPQGKITLDHSGLRVALSWPSPNVSVSQLSISMRNKRR